MTHTLVEWHEEFALGIADVDHEHREMIDLINVLYQTLMTSDDPHDAGHFLGELHARISAHFALEEKLMRQSRYDEYPAHKSDHEALLDDIRDLMDEFEDGIWIDLEAFAQRLQRWFTEHFRTHDSRLHQKLG